MNKSRLIAVIVLAGAQPACFGGAVSMPELYRLTPVERPASPEGSTNSTALTAGSIAISEYHAPGVYGGHGIVYSVEGAGYGVYPNREWAIPLSEMLGVLTENILARHPILDGPSVYRPTSTRAFTYEWRGSVREFAEVIRGKTVYAVVHLEVSLVRTADDVVLWTSSRRMERAVPGAGKKMPDIVATLSDLAHNVVMELSAEAASVLARPTPP